MSSNYYYAIHNLRDLIDCECAPMLIDVLQRKNCKEVEEDEWKPIIFNEEQ